MNRQVMFLKKRLECTKCYNFSCSTKLSFSRCIFVCKTDVKNKYVVYKMKCLYRAL